jgi:hypothetical protein
MKKIEKITIMPRKPDMSVVEITLDGKQGAVASDGGVPYLLARKLNEIIDYLNREPKKREQGTEGGVYE